jgi:hypothetical protein
MFVVRSGTNEVLRSYLPWVILTEVFVERSGTNTQRKDLAYMETPLEAPGIYP